MISKNAQFPFLLIVLVLVSSFQIGCNASKGHRGLETKDAVGDEISSIDKTNLAVSTIFEAEIGGLVGEALNQYMDKQAAELKLELVDVNIDRIGEGIVLTFPSAMLFDVDSFALKPDSLSNLARLVSKMQKYDDTEVLIYAHTERVGDPQYNLAISEKRAESLQAYFIQKRIYSRRLDFAGFGGKDSLFTNATVEGQNANRRIEIILLPNRRLRRAAKHGKISYE